MAIFQHLPSEMLVNQSDFSYHMLSQVNYESSVEITMFHHLWWSKFPAALRHRWRRWPRQRAQRAAGGAGGGQALGDGHGADAGGENPRAF